MEPFRFDPKPMDQLAGPPDGQSADWLWHGYLARGNVTLLTAQWKTGKTTLVAGLLRAMAAGGEFLGRACQAGTALVVSEESEPHWAARQRAVPIGPHARLLARPFAGRPTPDQWNVFVRRAARTTTAGPPDLVVVDPLAAFLPGRSDSDPGTLLDLLNPLRHAADCGAAVLVLHHPRKGPADDGSAARGSGALLGYVDVAVELHGCGPPAAGSRRRLLARSRLPDVPRALEYEWTPGTPDFRAVADPGTARFRENWSAVRSLLSARPSATHKELLAGWPPDRVPPSVGQLYEWLGRAIRLGWATRAGGGTRNDPFRFGLVDADDTLGGMEKRTCGTAVTASGGTVVASHGSGT